MEGWKRGVDLMPTLEIASLVCPNLPEMIQNVVIFKIDVLHWLLCLRGL